MKKQKGKKLLLAVIILALLLGVYLFLQKWNQSQEEAEETEAAAEQVMSVASDEIEELALQNGNGQFVFLKSEEGWVYEEDADFPLNQDTLDDAAGNLEEVTANRTLENPAELSEYGLDSPAVQVTVKKTDGTELTLQIGNVNSSTGDYYAKLDGEDEVYTIGSSVASAFESSLYDFAVEDSFPEISSADIDGLKIEREDGTLQFTYGDSAWTVSDGSREGAADSTKMNELTAAAGSLYYDSYVDYNAENLAEYGLDQPCATITIDYTTAETVESSQEDETDTEAAADEADTDAGSEETEAETETIEVPHQVILQVGSLVPADEKESEDATEESTDETDAAENYYYVKLGDSNAIHTVSESSLRAWLDVTYTDSIDSYVSDIPVTGMNALKVTYGGKTYTLTYQAESTTETNEDGEETESTEYTYYVDGTEVDSTLFTQFCNGAAAIQTQSRMEEEPENVGEAVLVLEYEKTDSAVLKVEYIPYESGLYLVRATEKQPGLVNKLDVEDLIGSLEKLLGQ